MGGVGIPCIMPGGGTGIPMGGMGIPCIMPGGGMGMPEGGGGNPPTGALDRKFSLGAWGNPAGGGGVWGSIMFFLR